MKVHKALNYARPYNGVKCGTRNYASITQKWDYVSCKHCLRYAPVPTAPAVTP